MCQCDERKEINKKQKNNRREKQKRINWWLTRKRRRRRRKEKTDVHGEKERQNFTSIVKIRWWWLDRICRTETVSCCFLVLNLLVWSNGWDRFENIDTHDMKQQRMTTPSEFPEIFFHFFPFALRRTRRIYDRIIERIGTTFRYQRSWERWRRWRVRRGSGLENRLAGKGEARVGVTGGDQPYSRIDIRLVKTSLNSNATDASRKDRRVETRDSLLRVSPYFGIDGLMGFGFS